jgi:hypothetical protein
MAKSDLGITVFVEGLPPKHKKIIVNGRVMIVLWDDKTKTRATCAPDDTFDPLIGFAVCLSKKLYGKKKLARMLRKVEVQE